MKIKIKAKLKWKAKAKFSVTGKSGNVIGLNTNPTSKPFYLAG